MAKCTCMAAYTAGFIDADGSISLRENGYPGILIGNTNREILEEIQIWAGVGHVKIQKQNIRGRKTFFSWRVYGKDAQRVLKRVQPFLRIKKARAEFGLTWIPKPRGRPAGQTRISNTTRPLLVRDL